MEALVILLFVINNIIWMFFLFILTPHHPSRSVKLPKISLKEIMKDLTPKPKGKKEDVTVDLMNANEDDIKEINEALSKGLNGQQ